MKRPKKILIVLFGAIGDVTRALPLATRIKSSWPDAKLCWAVEPISRGLVEHHPAIDRVLVFDRPRGLPAYRKLITEIRQEKFDLVLDLQRHLKSGVTSFLSGAPRRIGFSRKNSREGNWLFQTERVAAEEHLSAKITQFQKFGDALNLPSTEPLEFGLLPVPEQLEKIETCIRECSQETITTRDKRVALILGSTWQSRFWFVDHYVSLIEELQKRWGLACLLIGSDREKKFANEIIARVPAKSIIDLVGKTSISDLPAVFSSVRLAVGSDSGPMHIAAAVGTPVISLWGSTSPKRSAPYGSEHLILQSPIGCSPCYRRVCPGLGTLCMFDIPSRAVVERVSQVIQHESLR